MLKAILATDLNGCIGKDGTLPWKMKDDLKHFKSLTLGATVVMGRLTKESLPGTLPGRAMRVLSTQYGDWDEQCDAIMEIAKYTDVWIIGGAKTLASFIRHVEEFYLTVIDTKVDDGDAFFTFDESAFY